MSNVTITYRYLVDDEGPVTATWTGDRGDALETALVALNAKRATAGWAYHPDELREELAGEPLVVSADAMVELGAGLCDGHDLAELYDPWCASTAAAPASDAPSPPAVAACLGCKLSYIARTWLHLPLVNAQYLSASPTVLDPTLLEFRRCECGRAVMLDVWAARRKGHEV